MNKPMMIIVALFIGMAVLDIVIELLNLRSWSATLPAEFNGYYDAGRYETAQKYLADRTVTGLVKGIVLTAFIVVFILSGGFNLVDEIARGLFAGPVGKGLVFAGILFVLFFLVSLPFDVYDTFVIEEKYGFNRTTPRTFILDIIKSLVISGLLGAIVFSAVILLFEKTGAFAWIYGWLAVSCFQLLIMYVAPVIIMPLFNKFSPLGEGSLKNGIEQLAQRENYQIKGIYVIDGSRRSSKANAALTGFGKFKRIMLYDTLIKQMNEGEIIAVLAHEIGHYKHRHILKFIVISLVLSAAGFYLFSLVAGHPLLFRAFGAQHVSIYAALIYFSILLTPVQAIISVGTNWISRSFEYAADRYGAEASNNPEALISSLKKLSADSMANLSPHPAKVFFDYSHPPVLDRIRALRQDQPGLM
jgi:STE24 endopeptidase